jgi:hypothetical protein
VEPSRRGHRRRQRPRAGVGIVHLGDGDPARPVEAAGSSRAATSRCGGYAALIIRRTAHVAGSKSLAAAVGRCRCSCPRGAPSSRTVRSPGLQTFIGAAPVRRWSDRDVALAGIFRRVTTGEKDPPSARSAAS